jgi:NTE family protein
MDATPSSAQHFTSTTTSDGIIGRTPDHGDRPGSDQQVDAIRRARAAGGRALVLGGGGSAGNAWEIGVIAGLFDAGLDVTEADLIIGTSAGSTAAAQITSAVQPAELLAGILAAAPRPGSGPAGSDRGRVPDGPAADHMEKTSAIIGASEDAADMRRRMGAAALETDAASGSFAQAQRRAVVAARLPSQHWPQRPVLIVAVDAHTGEPVVFDRHSGVDLVDAVAASCAGPGLPPHGIGGSRYIDGGYRSNENADLAAGYGRVLVLSPLGGRSRAPLEWGIHLAAQAGELRARGSRVETIFPDNSSRNAFGVNLMDPSTRPPAARAGYDQGRALAGQLTEFWR